MTQLCSLLLVALEESQKVGYLKWWILGRKITFSSEISVKYPGAPQTCASIELAHGACQRAQEHLLTPSKLGDRASQSSEPGIFTKISYIIFTKDIHTRYSENTRSISDIFETDHAHNSKKLYLGAQMELEGVLGLVDMLRELVRPMRMFLGLYRTSQTSQIKKIIFSSKYPSEGYELFDIPLSS